MHILVVYMWVHVSLHVCGGQRKTCGVNPSFMFVMGFKHRSSGKCLYSLSHLDNPKFDFLYVLKKVLLISVSYWFSVGTTLPSSYFYYNVEWES